MDIGWVVFIDKPGSHLRIYCIYDSDMTHCGLWSCPFGSGVLKAVLLFLILGIPITLLVRMYGTGGVSRWIQSSRLAF